MGRWRWRWRWRWCWCWSVVLIGCTKPNPAFHTDLQEESTVADTGVTDSTSAATAGTTTHDVDSDVGTSGIDPSASGSTDATTSMTSSTSSTSSTDATTSMTSSTSTTDPDTSSTSDPPSEQELCDAAVSDPGAIVARDLYASWCDDTTAWGYALALADPYMPTTCDSMDLQTAVITASPTAKTGAGVGFGPSLATGPWKGPEGVVQGVYTAIDLADAAHPCVITRIARPLGDADQPLTAQVIAREAGLEDDFVLVDAVLASDGLVAVAAPIPPELHGKILEIVLVTIKQGVDPGAQPRLLWEAPRVVDAVP